VIKSTIFNFNNYLRIIIHLAILLLLIQNLKAQPDNSFEPFEWVQYRKVSSINSFTADNTFLYAGTGNSGILRLNIFTQEFAEPITRAQGLISNSIRSVHIAFGFLWTASDRGLEYSYDKQGDWHFVSKESMGIGTFVNINKIGNSEQYLWLKTDVLYIKCDRTSGYPISQMTFPDEQNIQWSSGTLNINQAVINTISDFSPWGGWMQNLDSFISPTGNETGIITHFIDKYGDLWVGTLDGTIFYGDNTMKTLSPLMFGLAGNDIQAISGSESFWLGGRNTGSQSGISYYDVARNMINRYEFEETINMETGPVFSILERKKDIWFAGNGNLLVYNYKDDFWRSLGIDRGIPAARINCMAETGNIIWLGTSNGLWGIDPESKRSVRGELENIFKDVFIYDLINNQGELWIAASTGLYIYNHVLKKLYYYKQYGNYALGDSLMGDFSNFTDLNINQGNIYAGNKFGILAFNIKSKSWSNAVDGIIWGNRDIRSFIIIGQYVFITEGKKIIRISLKTNATKQYSFPFIGVVNNLYFRHNKLWLGTTEGLISIDWKMK